MRMRASLVIYDKYGQLAAIVDIKKRLGTSTEWAIQLRSNLFAHGIWPKTPYFLVVVPDRIYLWQNAPNTPDMIEPDYEVDAWELLKPGYDMVGVPIEELCRESFELLVSFWFDKVGLVGLGSNMNPQPWLMESGLLEVLRDGRVASEVDI